MRKFLRLLMLALMVAYGAQGWSAKAKFRAGSNDKSSLTTLTGDDLTGDAGKYAKDEFTLKLTGNSNFGKHNNGRGAYWMVEEGSTLTISSTHVIYHISISFNSNGYHGAERIQVTSGGNWKKLDKVPLVERWSDGAWSPASGTEGAKSVTLKAVNSRADIFWIAVFYGEDNKGSDSKTLSITGTTPFTNKSSVTITSSGYSNTWWTYDGSDPRSSSTRTAGTLSNKTIDRSYTVRAVGSYTTKAKDYDSDVDDEDDAEFTIYDEATTHFQKYCDVNMGTGTNGTYGTLAHDFYMTVPTGFTASTYTVKSKRNDNTASVLTPKTTFTAGQAVPPNWAVVVARVSGSSTTARFINPDQNAGTTPTADGNVLSGNFTYAAATATDNTSKNFYYLMKEYSGDSRIGFFWGAASTDGKRGVPISLAAHRAYFAYDKAKTSGAKALTVIMPPSDGFSTGIDDISIEPDTDDNAPMYNTAGQRVGASYKGIVIQNGRKFIKK